MADTRTADYAPGLPDPKRFGDIRALPSGKVLQYAIQRHLAERAGPHYDVRIHGMPDDRTLSWATRKEWPGPGEKRMLFQQPLHRGAYSAFQGKIVSGYGKGSVTTHDKGALVVTHATPDKISFTILSRKFPETYTMVRQVGAPNRPTPPGSRERRTQGGSWLLMNTTPMNAAKFLGGAPGEVGIEKMRYTSIPADKVDKIFDPNYLVQEKIDGASALFHVLHDKIHAISYRVAKTGQPIVHSYRIFGPGGAKPSVKLDPRLEGSILRGEIYGETPEGRAIPPQELGGLLNAATLKSLQEQARKKVQLKAKLFDVVRLGKQPVPPLSMGAEERWKTLQDIVKSLPSGKFSLPRTATTPEEAKQLWADITSGKDPLTTEGVVAWPKAPGKPPIKVKQYPESDVWIRKIFPGEGKLEGTGAGGFEYSHGPEGPVAGRVGTGFDEEVRRNMLQNPEEWIGRLARVKAQERFPSGALRAPVFIARHEDYPVKAAKLSSIVRKRRALSAKEKIDRMLGLGDFVHKNVKKVRELREPQHSLDPGTGNDDGW